MSHTLTVTEQYTTVVEAEDAADVTVVEAPVSVSIAESDVSVDVTAGIHGDELHDATVASLVSGKVPTSELGAGSPGSTTFLRGDQSWQVPAGGGGGGAPTDANYVTTTVNGTLTDEILFSTVVNKGTLAARPAAGLPGRLYYVTDSGSQRWTRDTGSAWEDVSPSMNQLVAPTTSVSLNSQRITSLATPIATTDAATKAYADSIVQGLDWKVSVKAATTANITLSGTQTIDGVALVATDRVLVKNQTTGANNGIYDVAAGAWTRSLDADGSGGSEVNAGMATFIEQGTVAADTAWLLTTNNPITLGTTALVFTQFSGGSGYAPGGTDVALADGGTGASLVDPNADRIFFWDDSAGATAFLTAGAGLTITGTTIAASGVTIPAYTVSNVTTDRTYNANSYTLDELADVLGTLIADIASQTIGTYSVSNVTTDRTYNANATTPDELADVLGSLIADLQAAGVIG